MQSVRGRCPHPQGLPHLLLSLPLSSGLTPVSSTPEHSPRLLTLVPPFMQPYNRRSTR